MNPYHWKSISLRLIVALATVSTVVLMVTTVSVWIFLGKAGVFEPDDHLLAKITNHQVRSNTIVLSREAEKIGEFYEVDRVFTPFERIPVVLKDAIIAIEDRNFWHHSGFDPKGIIRATIANLVGGKTRQGASTISQQLVKTFILGNQRTLTRKAREMFLAVKLERQIPKTRIFELYANEMFLGNGAYGVAAAAKRYFSKKVEDLTISEAALIAGLFQSPSAYNPLRHPDRAKARQTQVLQALYKTGKISIERYREIASERVRYKPWSSDLYSSVAPWYLDHVKDEAEKIIGRDTRNESLVIHTTLSASLQKQANQVIAHAAGDLRRYEDDQPLELALIAIDHGTGGIVAMAGGRDYTISQFNRTTNARRQPGSSFKTFVYANALNKGWSWADRIFIDPVKFEDYEPKNMTDEFFTETTMLRAFYKSINTPAVEVAHKTGLSSLLDFVRGLGIETPLKRELGTALGSSGVTMLEMANAYGTIANAGYKSEPHSIVKITDRKGNLVYDRKTNRPQPEKIIDEKTAWLVTEGLRAVMKHGTGASKSYLARSAVGKTGTSNNGVDSWFVGYTGSISTAVWAGRDDHGAVPRAMGSSVALPVWADFIELSLKEPEWSKALKRPAGITVVNVDPSYGSPAAAGVAMAFISGTEPTSYRSSRQTSASAIDNDRISENESDDLPDIFER